MDLNFDGLIIETHCNPDKALSDAKQQVTPEGLKDILDRLILRDPEIKEELMLTLAELRDQIDKLDDRIINLLEERMMVSEKIGEYKKENNITILQTKRWDDMLKNRLRLGSRKGLSEDFIIKLFRSIHQESINHQTSVMNEEYVRMHQIQLNTPTGNTEILVGEFLSNKLIELEPSPILLVDEHVLCQHNDIFGAYPCISVPSGEQYKTLQTVEDIYRELVNLEADRSTLLVGVGGGLATDVAGFVASTYLREVPFGFISYHLAGTGRCQLSEGKTASTWMVIKI